jgi:flavin-dependent dehydrogenase
VSRHEYDVIVLGAGIAGCVATCTLADSGARVLCLESSAIPPEKIGESLPSAGRALLSACGLEFALRSVPNVEVSGAGSLWGGSKSSLASIQSPYGGAVILDRPAFEHELRRLAGLRGGILRDCCGRVRCLPSTGSQEVSYEWKERIVTARAPWMLDCTGRRSEIAVSRGAFRKKYDALVASWRIYRQPGNRTPASLLIESSANGWFYTVLLPDGARIVAFFTDSDLPESRIVRTEVGWNRLIKQTALISEILGAAAPLAPGPVRTALANTSRLSRAVGNGWLAAGDAACAYDPLSSQGMLAAIAGGANAASSMIEAEAGKRGALSRYQDWVETAFAQYLEEHRRYYGLIPTDYGGEFWRRRRMERPQSVRELSNDE